MSLSILIKKFLINFSHCVKVSFSVTVNDRLISWETGLLLEKGKTGFSNDSYAANSNGLQFTACSCSLVWSWQDQAAARIGDFKAVTNTRKKKKGKLSCASDL